jgi:lipopolysaccharide transport system ATP-binding protein
MSTVIKVENLSKQYRLGNVGTGTLSHDLKRWWYKALGKEDPYLQIGETNDRTSKGRSDYVWALKDINFEVKAGEVLGIIGRNGAGKSTLLKILSKTTIPTTGFIKVKGRIASLLEVGTGFHPELTGRENIYLNGAILGMTKQEIQSKFDEIVDFSGVERYIDTPVKRYSSGMYVRLAFAVAAHLEPEILIVDEVLAVGDAEFQKKCLGKMKDVSVNEGRTVLFVSHNMSAMNSLCNRVIYMINGVINNSGEPDKIINQYMSEGSGISTFRSWESNNFPGDDVAKLYSAKIVGFSNELLSMIDLSTGGYIECQYEVFKDEVSPLPNAHIFDNKGEYIFVTGPEEKQISSRRGVYTARFFLPPNLLNEGRYSVGLGLTTLIPQTVHFFEQQALVFEVVENMELRSTSYRGSFPGIIRPNLEWSVQNFL